VPTRFFAILSVCLACVLSGVACQALDTRKAPAASSMPALPGAATGVLTTAHETVGAAFNDFFARTPAPVQPIEFPHNTHIKQGVTCTEYCHESVTKGPVAGLPSVKTCMICHVAIATDRPRIQQITALSDKGLDLNWQRVYGYPAQSHVKFNHAPHIRAKVDCAKCHGDIGNGTVATRNVDLSMGYCVTCHNENKAPVDCLTCHF
jgi:hypothetical protein